VTLTEKLCLAVHVAFVLKTFSAATLERELEDAGHPELHDDEDFRRLLDERVFRCPECEEWHDVGYRMGDICVTCADDGLEIATAQIAALRVL
jgi:hypothetical protein